MTVTFNLPEWTAVPPLAWAIAGTLAWYVVSAIIVRAAMVRKGMPDDDRTRCVVSWLASPGIVVLCAAWAVVWAVSFGVVPAPWRRREFDFYPHPLDVFAGMLTFFGVTFLYIWLTMPMLPASVR